MVRPYQASQRYFPKSLLALCTTPVTALSMLVLDADTGKSLEYLHLRHHHKHQNIFGKNHTVMKLDVSVKALLQATKSPRNSVWQRLKLSVSFGMKMYLWIEEKR